jgi:hypothetical protein
MPIHRRRVYFDYSSSQRARTEGWLSLSIYMSAAILLLSLLGCLPNIIASTVGWLLPERAYRLGVISGTVPELTILCEIMMAFSGAYLAVALFIKSHTR